MEKLVDVLYQCSVQVWHLQRVIGVHGFSLSPEISVNRSSITKSFWQRFASTLEDQFTQASSGSTFIEGTFVHEYSRLAHIFSEFVKRLQSNHEVTQENPSGL